MNPSFDEPAGVFSSEEIEKLLYRYNDFFLRGDQEKANAERRRIEGLIHSGNVSKQQIEQFSEYVSKFDSMLRALARSHAEQDLKTALDEIDSILNTEGRFLPALATKGNRLIKAAFLALQAEDTVTFNLYLDRSILALTNAIRVYPGVPFLYLTRGTAGFHKCSFSYLVSGGHIDMGMLKGAAQDSTKAIELFVEQGHSAEQVAEAWIQKGGIYKLRGDYLDSQWDAIKSDMEADRVGDKRNSAYQKAISDFSRAIELNPTNSEAYSARGQVLLIMDRHLEAIDDLNNAIRLDPDNLDARITLVNWLKYQEGKRAANSTIKNCIYVLSIEPSHRQAQLALFDIVSKVLSEDPSNFEALEGLRQLEAVDGGSIWAGRIKSIRERPK